MPGGVCEVSGDMAVWLGGDGNPLHGHMDVDIPWQSGLMIVRCRGNYQAREAGTSSQSLFCAIEAWLTRPGMVMSMTSWTSSVKHGFVVGEGVGRPEL